jgi:hypothetical protein
MRAIDADHLRRWILSRVFKTQLSVTDVIDQIDREDTIEPERKKGKWIIYVISMLDGEGCKCSECGCEGASYWDFCPNCGADMREEDT